MASDSKNGTIEIDADALEKRYAEERARRLREDGIDQYTQLSGEFADFDADPNADPSFNRQPVSDEVDVLIIGGGFAGLLAGARLRMHGVDSFHIVEKGADFGGTWYWNRYPGARCDVEAYIYFPLLEETGYIPSEKYAGADEIRAHCVRIAKHYRLYEGALFQTKVQAARWDDSRKRWIVGTDRGDAIAARFLISCTGLFNSPKLPLLPGIEDFKGVSFHTSRWDYGYTGGSSEGNLEGLKGKRVGVIGTGSTGIQVIPHLARSAEHLYVFQRTPSSIDPRNNVPTDPEWARTLPKGWHRERQNNFTNLTSGAVVAQDLVNDGWTDIVKEVSIPVSGETTVDPEQLRLAQLKKMEMSRRHIESIVQDKETAEALKPYYHYFCKRPGFSDEYLQTYNRKNVTLVDTKGRGVQRITENGVIANGTEYALDCIVFATGFEFLAEYTSEAGVEIYGRGGLPLSEHWKDGARTFHGLQTHGFPNFSFCSLLQSGVTINYCHMADIQMNHVAEMIGKCLKNNIVCVEATQAAEDAWVEEVLSLAGPRRQFLEACTPGYYNYEGKRRKYIELNEVYGGGPVRYTEILEDWARKEDMPGLELQRGA